MAKTRFTEETGICYVQHVGVGWRNYDTNDAISGFPPRFVGPIYKTKNELLSDHENYLKRAGWMK